jgi:hypothetical protein
MLVWTVIRYVFRPAERPAIRAEWRDWLAYEDKDGVFPR